MGDVPMWMMDVRVMRKECVRINVAPVKNNGAIISLGTWPRACVLSLQ